MTIGKAAPGTARGFLMAARVSMDGLNQVGGMVQARLLHRTDSENFLAVFLRVLAQDRINMNLCLATRLEGDEITCCVADTQGNRLKSLADSLTESCVEVEFHGTASLLSVFPHRSSLKTLGLALTALAGAHVPLYGFCSSLSALTFTIDQDHCGKALTALSECFEIPPAQVYVR
jgi:aspartokinase